MRHLCAVHRVSELLGWGRIRVVAPEVAVIRLVAVRAPVALEHTGRHVDYRHAMIAIAVGQIGLVGGGIDPDLGHTGVVGLAAAVDSETGLADLKKEAPVAREFQDVRIAFSVPSDPDVVHVIDRDPVIRRRPGVAGARPSPVADNHAVGIELQDGRRRHAAGLCNGRVECRRNLARGQRGPAAMHDPDVVPGVNANPDGRTQDPVIRQWAWPEGVDLEHWCLLCLRLDGRRAEPRLTEPQGHDRQHAPTDQDDAARAFHGVHSVTPFPILSFGLSRPRRHGGHETRHEHRKVDRVGHPLVAEIVGVEPVFGLIRFDEAIG